MKLSYSFHNVTSIKYLLPVVCAEVVKALFELKLRVAKWLFRGVVGGVVSLRLLIRIFT
jgi:hypothetical protein